MMPSGAHANWPGPGGGSGSMRPPAISTSTGTALHGLSSAAVHAASARWPPGRSTRRVSSSAAAGSSISM